MPRTVQLAAVQMDANPAGTAERIARADRLVRQAADAGAQLIVLPELFHLGYGYDDSNFARAETLHGPSVTWMRDLAAGLGVHLAGSVLLRDGGEIYNALLLFAPNGRMWRYDKNYPWGWERGYFIGRRNIVVADTELGRIGMLVCWDAAHRNLWREYAGKVDVMIISSCPPDVGNGTYHFPDGDTITVRELGPLMASTQPTARRVFGDMINQQTAWLGVPTVAAVGSGRIQTAIPRGKAVLAGLLPFAPQLAKHLHHADQLELSCAITQGCKVVDGHGVVLTELPANSPEGWTLAATTLPDGTPQPRGSQPPSTANAISYLLSDWFLPTLMRKIYRDGKNGVPTKQSMYGRIALVAGLVALLLWLRSRRLGGE